MCNKDSSTPALNATAETDRSVDGGITPHPAALSILPYVSLLRVTVDSQVRMQDTKPKLVIEKVDCLKNISAFVRRASRWFYVFSVSVILPFALVEL